MEWLLLLLLAFCLAQTTSLQSYDWSQGYTFAASRSISYHCIYSPKRALADESRTYIRKVSVKLSGTASVSEQLGLHDTFDRWRFLQNLLDEETNSYDTTFVLFAMLDRFLNSPLRFSGKQGLGESTTSTPILTSKLRECMEVVLEEPSAQAIRDLLEGKGGSKTEILDQLEKLLPDPREDEDAFNGLWDTVIELNGRESVKINERNGARQWKTRCLVARVLLYYDFLSAGV